MSIGRHLLALCLCGALGCSRDAPTVRIGSKAFTESVVLGEVLRLTLERARIPVVHREQLGGSRVVFEALRSGEIDAYVEYTGTLSQELLSPHPAGQDAEALEGSLKPLGIRLGPCLGFDNTYGLGIRREQARRLGIERISQLQSHPELRYAISHELLARADGFRGLLNRYGLPWPRLRAVEHAVGYRALSSGDADVVDVYTTDPEIVTRDIRVLEDDLSYFPEYAAVVLVREDALASQPALRRALATLRGRLDVTQMAELNARVVREGLSETAVAAEWLGHRSSAGDEAWLDRLRQRSQEHLMLVGLSLLAALLVALPLGIACARRERLGRFVLGASGVLQTIPSLALLVLLIPLLGIGRAPAIAALFLYSLLPIVQNTVAGLRSIDPRMLESATVIGLSPRQRMIWIELPLSLPTIVAGIKTAAVINVGTATLGALVGAGGYGQPIITGIRLNDMALIAEGAIPASLLALLAQLAFDQLERQFTPRAMRSRRVHHPPGPPG